MAEEQSSDAPADPPGRKEWYVKTKADVAAFFGISYAHTNQLQCFRDYEKTAWGYYLPDLVKRRHDQTMRSPQSKATEMEGSLGRSLTSKKRDVVDQDLRRKTRENDEKEGLLIPRLEVERNLVDWAVRFRTPLMGLATRIMALVPGSAKASAKRMVQDEVRNALVRIRDMPYTAESLDSLIEQEYHAVAKKKAAKKTAKKATPKKKKAAKKAVKKKKARR